jgi:hypothetical protein
VIRGQRFLAMAIRSNGGRVRWRTRAGLRVIEE